MPRLAGRPMGNGSTISPAAPVKNKFGKSPPKVENPFESRSMAANGAIVAPDGKTLYYVSTKDDSELWRKTLPAEMKFGSRGIAEILPMNYQVTDQGVLFHCSRPVRLVPAHVLVIF